MSEIMIRPDAELEGVEVLEVVDLERSESEAGVIRRRDERGLVSAEWVMGIIAATALAGVLLTLVTSEPVRTGVLNVIKAVLSYMVGQIG